MSSPKSPIIEVRNQKLTYPAARKNQPPMLALAVDSLVIQQGDHIALLGKSGVGKSTLLKFLRNELADNASWCPQQTLLVPQLKVYHNIYSGSLTRHPHWLNLKNLFFPTAKFVQEITELTKPLGIDDLLWQHADELSGGQQQRVAIARSLYQRKPTLLADEPISALDKQQGPLILKKQMAQHSTSITALHDAALAKQLCNRIIGLKDKKILFDLAVDDVTDKELNRLYQ